MLRSFLTFLLLLCLCLSALPSCSANEEPLSVSFFSMDTYMTLKAYRDGHTEEETREALNAAKAEILRIEQLFSVTSTDSEISRLNRGEALEDASADLIHLLRLSAEMHNKTNGAYDVTVYPLVELWGFTGEQQSVPAEGDIHTALLEIDFNKITVTQTANGGYSVSANGARLDLGSIAKGYAGQRASELLAQMGFNNVLLVLGGNVQLSGTKPDGSPFRIGIADPHKPDGIAFTLTCSEALRDKLGAVNGLAVVTSGTYQRNFEQDGKVYHHLLDLSSGYPCENGLSSVTVICPDGARADALSSSLFLLGYEKSLELYRAEGDFEAIFITNTGEKLFTDGIG